MPHISQCPLCRAPRPLEREDSLVVCERHPDRLLLPSDVVAQHGDELHLGLILDGKYELWRPLGHGGFGSVYFGFQRGQIRREVAVKLLTRQSPEYLDLFRDEMRVVSQLRSPYTVRYLDSGVHQEGGARRELPYMVMEYLRGETLAHRLIREGALNPDRAVELFSQLLESLDEAHGFGIVHRDIKPLNLMLSPTRVGGERLTVLDFGVARVVDQASREATRNRIMGTPYYLAPEVLLNQEVTPSGDLFAVGVILYETLMCRSPFLNEELSGLEPYLKLRAYYKERRPFEPLSPPLEARFGSFFRRALAVDPAARFGSALEMLEALRAARAAPPPLPPPVPPPLPVPPAPPSAPDSTARLSAQELSAIQSALRAQGAPSPALGIEDDGDDAKTALGLNAIFMPSAELFASDVSRERETRVAPESPTAPALRAHEQGGATRPDLPAEPASRPRQQEATVAAPAPAAPPGGPAPPPSSIDAAAPTTELEPPRSGRGTRVERAAASAFPLIAGQEGGAPRPAPQPPLDPKLLWALMGALTLLALTAGLLIDLRDDPCAVTFSAEGLTLAPAGEQVSPAESQRLARVRGGVAQRQCVPEERDLVSCDEGARVCPLPALVAEEELAPLTALQACGFNDRCLEEHAPCDPADLGGAACVSAVEAARYCAWRQMTLPSLTAWVALQRHFESRPPTAETPSQWALIGPGAPALVRLGADLQPRVTRPPHAEEGGAPSALGAVRCVRAR